MTTIERSTVLDAKRHPISRERPRLLGTRSQLQELSRQRPEAFKRMMDFARGPAEETGYDLFAIIIGLAVAYVLEGKKEEGRRVVDLVLKNYIDQPVKSGHVTFAHDMARCAIAYDLCHDQWTPEERERFSKYAHATIAANHESEPSVFHNGWWGYKHWGYGMAGYALMYDDPEASTILRNLEHEYLEDGAPALKMAGDGGGWAEGYYIHYWSFEWLFFCEVARWVEGVDYYAAAPEFWGQRAIAAMFEFYPKIESPVEFKPTGNYPPVKATGISRRPIPMGDGHGKFPKHERDKTLTSQRILVNYHRNDPAHQAAHTFASQLPKCCVPCDAFMDFFWNDATVKAGDLGAFKLSHVSPGAGYVYARSSWKEDATHFFLKIGRRFTAHQHMDNGHFMLFKNEELLGDGGHYDGFSSEHGINYYMRTIAHNSILIYDPSEKFPAPSETDRGMRAGPPGDNDGGQDFPWSIKSQGLGNGGARDVALWEKNRELLDIGKLTAYRDRGSYVYLAGDYTRSYSAKKAKCVTRQIVYLRPGTFVIFDRVESTNPAFKKTFLLQAMKGVEKRGEHWVMTHGNGRLFVQTLSPANAVVELYQGDKLYEYHGHAHGPKFEMDAAPECRMEVSPSAPSAADYFLHVLTTADAGTNSVAVATSSRSGNEVTVKVGEAAIKFMLDRMEGSISLGQINEKLTDGGVK